MGDFSQRAICEEPLAGLVYFYKKGAKLRLGDAGSWPSMRAVPSPSALGQFGQLGWDEGLGWPPDWKHDGTYPPETPGPPGGSA